MEATKALSKTIPQEFQDKLASAVSERDELRAFVETRPTPEEASTNFYWTVGKNEVFNLQTTVRGALTDKQVKLHIESVLEALKLVVKLEGHAKAVGKQDNHATGTAATVATPGLPAPTNGVPPPPAVSAGASESACAMIEVNTSYTGNKTQLSFHVNGMDKPLRYTQDVAKMAALLAPLGFTAAHIVVGQKYSVNCIVTWQQAEKYKNVLSVRKA